MSIQKLSYWLPMTAEAIDDAPWTRLLFEYAIAGDRPLTSWEALTGWRWFTSSDGLRARFRVGWRLRLANELRVAKCAATGHRLGSWEWDDEDWEARECECRTHRESRRIDE